MNKDAFIFHGTSDSSESYWIPWLKGELEGEGYSVWAPDLPDSNGQADLDLWVEEVEKAAPTRAPDLMVGHSAGVPLILKLLSKGFETQRAVCVAGFIDPLPHMDEDHLSYPRGFDFAVIKAACRDFVFIHSDNDPWGCDHKQGEAMRSKLGGTLVVRTGEGHFGSETNNQPYKTFPLLLAHCLLEKE